MIAGRDSSFDRPTPAVLAAASAAGVRAWGGYFGIRPRNELGLAVLWDQADFEVVKAAGMTAIGFCSGWDDPVAIRDRAAAWGILACVDVEPGIRDAGPWMQGWLDASNAGLYGLGRIHAGIVARFHIMSLYPGYDPGATWSPAFARPGIAPVGWQWQGGHSEFGIDVDSMWLDDWFASLTQGGPQPMTDEEVVALFADWYRVYAGRWPSQGDLDYTRAVWLPAWRASPLQARADFGTAAAAEVQGKDVSPVRRLELDAALATLPAGPAGPAGPPGPPADVSGLAKATHTHDVAGATGPAK